MSTPARTESLAARGQLGWLVLVVGAWSAVLLTLRLDPDYTAGVLLDHVRAWQSGASLYPALSATPPYRALNYPPLVLLLVRGLAATGVATLTAGRLVNGLGLAALVSGVAWWARARGARGAALAGTVGLLGASFPLVYGAGQLHIELWAAAGTVWGFALLGRGSTRGGALAAGAVLAAASFAKQTEVVLALVSLAWVWRWRREAAARATGAFVAVGLVGAAAITGAWGPGAWRDLVTYTVGTYSLTNLGAQVLAHLVPWAFLLGLAVWRARTGGAAARRDIVWWYWLGALLWSLSAIRRGSGWAYFLDLHVATALWVGPWVFGRGGGRRPSRIWTWLLAVQVVGADVGVGAAVAVNLLRLERTESGLPALCARLRGRGAVLAEEPGVVRACGHAALIDPFLTTSLARRGLWDARPFERSIGKGELDLAVLPFDPRAPVTGVHAERWTEGALRAFRSAPSVERTASGEWIARW